MLVSYGPPPLVQGREKDICLFSAVRSPAAPKKGGRRAGIGFVADERRINVGLTRARCSLIVIGNVRALQVRGGRGGFEEEEGQDGVWRGLDEVSRAGVHASGFAPLPGVPACGKGVQHCRWGQGGVTTSAPYARHYTLAVEICVFPLPLNAHTDL